MEKIKFLPGPVKLHKDIFKDLAVNPMSHRTEKFKKIFDDTCMRLAKLVNAKHSALFMGSGTMANEVIAAQLKTMKGKGLIISNGEFGERLAEQAERFSLKFKHLAHPWGESFDYEEINKYILTNKPAWVWFTHVETSTGILNDLPAIKKICKKVSANVCVDVISSIGNMPLNLKDVFLASASSGKGLAGFSGLAIVFSNHIPTPGKKLPKYFDLGYYYSKNKVPFTFSYNLIFALNRELKRTNFEKRFAEIEKINKAFVNFFDENSIRMLGNPKDRTNFIITLAFNKKGDSVGLGNFCSQNNIGIHYKNDYLKARNWVQLAFMGHHRLKESKVFCDVFNIWLKKADNCCKK